VISLLFSALVLIASKPQSKPSIELIKQTHIHGESILEESEKRYMEKRKATKALWLREVETLSSTNKNLHKWRTRQFEFGKTRTFFFSLIFPKITFFSFNKYYFSKFYVFEGA